MKKFPIEIGLSDISRHRQMLYSFCALWVMAFHARFKFPHYGLFIPMAAWQTNGACGVEIFLLLSAFGLYHSYAKNPHPIPFLRRRFRRVLFPAFIVVTAFQLYLRHSPVEYVVNATFLLYWLDNTTLWFVSFILTMYLIYPMLYRLQQHFPASLYILFLIGCITMFYLETKGIVQSDRLKRGISRIPVFLLGCMLAPHMEANISIKPKTILILSLFSLLGLGAYHTFISIPFGTVYCQRAICYMFLGISVMLVLVYAGNVLSQLPGPGHYIYRWMSWLGQISLECYLLFSVFQRMFFNYFNVTDDSTWQAIQMVWYSFCFAVVGGFMLRWLCERLNQTFDSVSIPAHSPSKVK